MAHLDEVLTEISEDLKRLQGREGSKYVGPSGDPTYAATLAESQRRTLGTDVWRGVKRRGEGDHEEFASFLRDVKAARNGDPNANRRLERKTWNEGGDGSAGGFLVQAELLPGYVEQRRAAAPLAALCSHFTTRSDSVTIITEGDAVQIVPTAEAATKLETTGSIGVKVATTHKLAGITRCSDELLADAGAIEALIRKQMIHSHDIAQDSEIVAGSGVGQPVGILNAAGVPSTPVDGQSGAQIFESIVKALARRAEAFYPATHVVMAPRDLVRFRLAKDNQGRYLFGSFADMFPGVQVIADPNLPTNLGVGGDESVAVVGDFKAGCYVWTRQPITIDASSHVGFVSDTTVWRLVSRWGFAVVQVAALEILTQIEPS